jgi:hypothetical protein
MFSFFSRSAKAKVTAPSVQVQKKPLRELIQEVETKEGALSIWDYPRGQYSAYWEILASEVPGGYRADLRIHSFDTGAILQEGFFTGPDYPHVQAQIDKFVRAQMIQYKR